MRRCLLLLVLIPCCAPAQSIPAGGLPIASAASTLPSPFAWYKFDEGSGSTAADSSGNGYTATWTGTSAYVAGRVGAKAASFTGANALFTAAYPSLGKQVTIAAWFKAGTISSTEIVAELSPNSNNTNAFAINFNSGGTLGMGLHDTAGYNTVSTNASYNDGNWHHLAVVFDLTQSSAAQQIAVYVDGSRVAVTQGYSVAQTTAFSATYLYVGARNTSSYFYTGYLDDLRVYATTLTAVQIAGLASQHN